MPSLRQRKLESDAEPRAAAAVAGGPFFPSAEWLPLRPSLLNGVVPATGPEHLLEILLFSEPDISSKAIEGMYFIVVKV